MRVDWRLELEDVQPRNTPLRMVLECMTAVAARPPVPVATAVVVTARLPLAELPHARIGRYRIPLGKLLLRCPAHRVLHPAEAAYLAATAAAAT